MTPTRSALPLTPEQGLAVAQEAPYVLVSASAGTGKTRTLIAKVLETVGAGTPLEQLVAITFTQRAAEELKGKLTKAFAGSDRLAPLRLLLAQAHISTIDAFCARLLRENAIAAGVDPAFRVLADPEDELFMTEIIDLLFQRWYLGRAPSGGVTDTHAEGDIPERGSPAHQEFLRLVELCRYRGGREVLKLEVQRLVKLARVHPDPAAFIDRHAAGLGAERPPYLEALGTALRQTWQDATSLYGGMLATGSTEFPDANFAQHGKLYAALLAAPWPANTETLAADLPGALQRIREHLTAAGCLGEESYWAVRFPSLPKGTADRLKSANELAKHLISKTARSSADSPFAWLPRLPGEIGQDDRRTAPTLVTLLALVRQSLAAYEARKREEGLLDFADLELHVRRLLLQAPPVLGGHFDLVLVDEFQDVNRLQAEIVERLQPRAGRFLVGDVKQCIYQFRLSDPTVFRELASRAALLVPAANAVADTAERIPGVQAGPVRVPLTRNFRSRYPVLRVVNALFSVLFTPRITGIDYLHEALSFWARDGLHGDALQQLAPGVPMIGTPTTAHAATACSGAGWSPVEFHLIAPEVRGRGTEGTPPLEREATLIARRIRALVAEQLPIWDREQQAWRPVTFGDIALLVRSPGPTGATLARLLRRHGVPVVHGGQDFFQREEVRDALNLLRLLDNAHDDIALAGVLRSPLLAWSDGDLARLRLAWPDSHFLIAAIRATARGQGDDWSGPPAEQTSLDREDGNGLARRCRVFLAELDRWRSLLQTTDLAGAIAAAFEESGLMEVAGIMEGGAERTANLQQLLALARQHCLEREHSLSGLVRYLATLESSGGLLDAVAAEGRTRAAVQLLSLHKAKGLEFPVVFVSLVGRHFNLVDVRNEILTGEQWMGVDAFDPASYIKIPMLPRRLLARMRRRETLEEEARILYVALTRATEKLIVTGSLAKPWSKALEELSPWQAPGEIPAALVYRARAPIEWILGMLHRHHLLAPLQPDEPQHPDPWLQLTWHRAAESPAEIAAHAPAPEPSSPPGGDGVVRDVGCEPPVASLLPALARRLQRRYPHEAATRWRGKYWVTEIKRLVDAAVRDEERAAGTDLDHLAYSRAPERCAADGSSSAPPSAAVTFDAVEEGAWLHAVLQALDLTSLNAGPLPPDAADRSHDSPAIPSRQMQAALACAAHLAERGVVPHAWVVPERVAPVAAFLATPLAREMGAAGAALEREIGFSLRLSPQELVPLWPDAGQLSDEEWILVQGQIDALWRRPDGTLVVLDFKSDRVATPDEIARRAERYRPQLWLYRQAATRLWQAERVECQLYFLRPARAVEVR